MCEYSIMHNGDMQAFRSLARLVSTPHQDPAYMHRDPAHNHCPNNRDRNRRT